ncbi:helix-turn-helix domain-containing protein [Streptomyces virginiae]|uniref:helix-turn-helix domain-containing protein n=1 Tax=Streptomyces virginiae TaxID=1961 RepID=UPI00224E673D|nr:helix-turn-helix transcriptional regulator [Streptomyces virginiae]MCX5273680.1 helix-turn-helix domain-containing protein [Streptomyces virginiae]
MRTFGDDHPGSRIRAQRRLAHLTQKQLAELVPYSYSLLNQVECGARPATDAFLAAVAKALRIAPSVLTGQPHVSTVQQDRREALVRPIRDALALYDLGHDPDVTARPLDDLVTAADRLCATVRATKLREASRVLPGVIAELTSTAWSTPSTEAWRALASAYRSAHDIALKLGFYDLSTVALDRMDWAAERASDPCLAAVRQYKRALVHSKSGEYRTGERLIEAGLRVLEQAEESRERLAVTGQLHLGASVIAARAEDQAAVERHISEARTLAKRTGDASGVHWLSFGPMNVAVHAMSALTQMGQYDDALTAARKIRPSTTFATSRRAHFLIYRARAEMETGNATRALASLTEARQAAPEQTRYHPSTQETIRGLVQMARRTPESLGHLAVWVEM